MKFHKVKAGSIQFAIMISAIIAVLLSVFMVLLHSHSMFVKKSNVLIETVQQAENVLLSEIQNFSVQRDTTFLMIDEDKEMTSKTYQEYWGMYGKVYVETNIKSKSFEKIALVSGWQKTTNRTGLYLQETNRPLIVVGNTKIEGKTYVPERGVRAGTISGNSYHGNTLIYGTILKSKGQLPKLPKTLTNQLTILQRTSPSKKDANYIDISTIKLHSNSFKETTKMVFSRNEIDLLGITLIGNIIVRSDKKIKVTTSTVLKDVILIAPKIEIEDNSKGTFQAIASEQIIVGKNCELMYPSALVMLAEDDVETTNNTDEKKHVFIDKNTSVKGMICYLQDETKNRFEPQIILKENTNIEGFVYCEQQLELLGNVHGSLYAKGFITKQFGSIYQNHIYNGTISSTKLINEYVGFPLENLDYKVVKWLY